MSMNVSTTASAPVPTVQSPAQPSSSLHSGQVSTRLHQLNNSKTTPNQVQTAPWYVQSFNSSRIRGVLNYKTVRSPFSGVYTWAFTQFLISFKFCLYLMCLFLGLQ